jgi:hypothetical protein
LVLLESYGALVARCLTVNVFRPCRAIALAAILLATPALGAAAAEPATAEQLPSSVLFIGNSHTARHGGLDWLVANFVAAEGQERPFDGTTSAEGGVTLAYHWQNGAPGLIQSGRYDTVVLQGYLPGSETRSAEPFLQHARLLDEVIGEAGARTVFFMTWPNGIRDWSTVDDVVQAHRLIAAELDADVAPAALAFEKARAERPDLDLIAPDRIHATWPGAYLAAATVYATLFERSPEGLPFSFGLDPDTAGFLQRIAWETVTEWRAEVMG